MGRSSIVVVVVDEVVVEEEVVDDPVVDVDSTSSGEQAAKARLSASNPIKVLRIGAMVSPVRYLNGFLNGQDAAGDREVGNR